MPVSTVSRLTTFVAGLAVLGGGAAAVGASTGATPPFQDCLKATATDAGIAGARDAMASDGADAEPMAAAVSGADGLRSQLAGVRLVPASRAVPAGGSSTLRFRLLDCDGEPIRDVEPENGKLLHLIFVREDLTAYQHVHPRLGRDGTWSVVISTPRAGRYRAIADFVLDGRKYVLGTTLFAPGGATDVPLPPRAEHAAGDGYDVALERPATLAAGKPAQLTFRVTRHGRPVTDLEPYLGAFGHLVALHAPDLAYSHVHPDGEDRSRGAITFATELRARGRYRLFLQFRTDGRVHTVAFTQPVA